MSRRTRLLFLTLGLVICFSCWGMARSQENKEKSLSSKSIDHLQSIFTSKDYNEVPFFLGDGIAFESGDNKNDTILFYPCDGFGPEIWKFQADSADFSELENPRPVLPDGRQFVFSAIGGNGKKGIYLVKKIVFGSGKHSATPLLLNDHHNWHPSLNSQKQILVFTSDAAGSSQIFIDQLNTGTIQQLSFLKKAESPFIDAKGEWVYFTGIDESNNYDIYKIKPDWSGLTRLTFSPEIEKYPTLTCYGHWIVYERGTKTQRAVWIMTLDGKTQKQVSDTAHWASGPCMNYTGTKIVFEGQIDGKKGIYLGEVNDQIYRGATAREFSPGLDLEKEVVNLSQFGTFTPAQLEKLSQYGFFGVATDKKQLFYTYEENEYKNIPSFVTADNIMQLLHVAFDTSLRKTEEQNLLPILIQFATMALTEMEKHQAWEEYSRLCHGSAIF